MDFQVPCGVGPLTRIRCGSNDGGFRPPTGGLDTIINLAIA